MGEFVVPRPRQVAGIRLSTAEDADQEVRAQLHGIGRWSRTEDPSTLGGLERAIREAGPWRDRLLAAVADHLGADDLEVRTRAVVVCATFAEALGPHVFVAALTEHPALYAGVPPRGHPTNQPDLRWTLLSALGQTARRRDTVALALLRAAAEEPRGWWLAAALARVDTAWLLDNAARVVPRSALGGVLLALPGTVERVALLRALGPWSAADRARVAAEGYWPRLPDAAEIQAGFGGDDRAHVR